jgi:hypothetical protein
MAKKQVTAISLMTEKEWSAQFKQLFELYGWKGYHPYLSIHSERGWPDWSLINLAQKRVIFVELKTEKGKLSESQIRWQGYLASCGQEWYCLRPSDIDKAIEILQAKPGE